MNWTIVNALAVDDHNYLQRIWLVSFYRRASSASSQYAYTKLSESEIPVHKNTCVCEHTPYAYLNFALFLHNLSMNIWILVFVLGHLKYNISKLCYELYEIFMKLDCIRISELKQKSAFCMCRRRFVAIGCLMVFCSFLRIIYEGEIIKNNGVKCAFKSFIARALKHCNSVLQLVVW